MEVILTHEQADFDAAGSVLAAWLLDDSRVPVLPKKRNRNLAAFLEDHKDQLPFYTWRTAPKSPVTRIFLTDTQIYGPHERLEGCTDVIVWDHHPERHLIPDRKENIYDPTGACTTFLTEQLSRRPDVHPDRICATLMLMGIYEDTGFLSYGSTTSRDIRAAAWLVDQGADLDLLRHYLRQPLTENQQQACDLLQRDCRQYDISGLKIMIAAADVREYSDEYSTVAHHLRDSLLPDGLILLLAVKTGIRVICRAMTDAVNFGKMMTECFGGGGHSRAASGMILFEEPEPADVPGILEKTRERILEMLPAYIDSGKINLSEKLNEKMAPDQLELIRRAAESAERLHMPVYLVGGVVRDLLLDRPLMDYDLVVEGDAIRLGQQLAAENGGKLVPHGSFFTAKWEPRNGIWIDLISARSETYAAPAALPTVAMGDMEADLRRRDFTINTLALRLDGDHYGELLDICGGLSDLGDEWIRTLHERSFIDDPTRMFRAVRFEQRFDFHLERDTRRQLRKNIAGIRLLTGQRIWHELKLFCRESRPEDCFSRIVQLGIAAQIHRDLLWSAEIEKDLNSFREDPAEWRCDPPDPVISLVDEEGMLWVWLSALPEETVRELGERLLLSKKSLRGIEGTAVLRREFGAYTGKKPSEAAFFLDSLPLSALYCYSRFCRSAEERRLILEYEAHWRKMAAFTNGKELLRKGVQPGPMMQEILSALRAARIDGEVNSPEEEDKLLKERFLTRI